MEPCASQATPCPLFLAAGGNAGAGDEVVLAPGEYSDLEGDIGPQGLTVRPGVHLHGAAGQPRPLLTIEGTVTPSPVVVSQGAILSRVEIRTETVNRNVVVEGEARGILAVSRFEGPNTMVCEVRQGVLRDSACLAERGSSAGAGVSMSASLLTFNATLRNVTAVGEIGLKFEVNGDAQYAATVSNTIAKGTAQDVLVRALSPDPHTPGTASQVRVTIDHSAYATASTATDAGNGVATVTAAGSPTNIVAAPQLLPDGYHQVETSPTISAGASQVGDTVDIDGQQRALGFATDIGADEVANPTGIANSCDPKVLETGSGVAHCTVFVRDLSGIQGPLVGLPSRPSGTVTFVTNAPGSFSNGGVCTLEPVGPPEHSSCRIDYTPTAVTGAAHNYTAFYSGDGVHDAFAQPGFFNVLGLGEDHGGGGGGGGGSGGGGSGGGGNGGSGGGIGPVIGIAPSTALTKKPAKRTNKRIARFQFVSDQPGSSFECKLDKRPFKVCKSPFKAKALKRGRHTFMVRAKNSAGVPDSTPAVYRWRVR
ncbi:MAG TPA: hypothetical protein VMS60_08570 [Solirubrobacterales bacterium]|nr:hypothetical protein [Solirubrobacterales bacterium]